jgi:hypothetical protein
MKRKSPRSVFTTAVLSFIRLNGGSNVLNVHAGFPDVTIKAVSNSLSSLWNGNYLTRVKGVTKNVSGQTLYDYTAKTIAPKRAKPVLLWKDIIAVTPEEDEAMSKLAMNIDAHSSGHQFDIPKSILDEAQEIIYGDREKTYGAPDKNLKMIGDLWAAYSGVPFTAEDVCNMMILLKVARLANDPKHRDSQVDLCGYAALMERIQK